MMIYQRTQQCRYDDVAYCFRLRVGDKWLCNGYVRSTHSDNMHLVFDMEEE